MDSVWQAISNFFDFFLDGLGYGAVYAVIALGYTMVYGIAKMLNFAHGDVIMVGAYIAYTVTISMGMNPLFGVVSAIVVCTLLGVLIERLAYKPLRGAPSLAVLITAIGVSFFLQNAAQLIWSTDQKGYAGVASVDFLTPLDAQKDLLIVTLLVAVAIMVGLTLFVNKSKMGKAMRAVSEDREAAQLMGINVNRTIATTFAIGSALAAVAGVLLCAKTGGVSPMTGSMPGIRAFTAAVFGGIGSIPGAMLGGMLIGMIESLSGAYISNELKDAIVFLVLIVVLLFKPAGLLGKRTQEKV